MKKRALRVAGQTPTDTRIGAFGRVVVSKQYNQASACSNSAGNEQDVGDKGLLLAGVLKGLFSGGFGG